MSTGANLPSRKELITGWVLLMALTIGTMIAGRVTNASTLGFAWLSALLVITYFKARTILNVYLNLQAAPRHWKTGFSAILIVLLLAIAGIYALHSFGIVARR
jgi:hypothetical protein